MRLPRGIRGREVVRALERAGWRHLRTRGSHAVLQKAGHAYTISVPLHDEVGPGTLRGILRDADITLDEFLKLL